MTTQSQRDHRGDDAGTRQDPPPISTDFRSIQAHYDLSNDFFALFLDPAMVYTCAKFDSPDVSLEQAQRAKIDHTLAKLDLRPGHRLLEVGCGWGAAALRARERYNAHVVALTLSRAQHEYACDVAAARNITTGVEYRLEGWETFREPVDRILSIGAMEHFGVPKYPAFFQRCRALLPPDGVLVLHLITQGKPSSSFAFLRFRYFLSQHIFPNAFAPPPEIVIQHARAASFELVHVESLRLHYALTLDHWAANLTANRDRACALTSRENYDTYMKYLLGCATYFRGGEVNLHQFRFLVC